MPRGLGCFYTVGMLLREDSERLVGFDRVAPFRFDFDHQHHRRGIIRLALQCLLGAISGAIEISGLYLQRSDHHLGTRVVFRQSCGTGKYAARRPGIARREERASQGHLNGQIVRQIGRPGFGHFQCFCRITPGQMEIDQRERWSFIAALNIACLLHVSNRCVHASGSPFEQAVFVQDLMVVVLLGQQCIESLARFVKTLLG